MNPQPTLINKSSLENMDFLQLSSLYEQSIKQYQSLYQDFINNYNPNGVICGISRAYYWGNQISSYNNIPQSSDFTTLAQNSFGQYLRGGVSNSPLQVNNTALGVDPEPGVPKYLWIDFMNDRGQTGTISFPEGSTVNWASLTNNSIWSNSSCGGNSSSPSSFQLYMTALKTLEDNIQAIHDQMSNVIQGGDANYFSNLDTAYKNGQTMIDQYNSLRDYRKQILQKTFQYQPPLESSSIFVRQSNYLYFLIFGLLIVCVFIFFYKYYGSFMSSVGQTGGARGKNYLMLFALFIILAIILKFLS